MALKDIFTMVKADRYTQDGREEIIKAQEAETKDARRTYQIGEISETTGLQKTENGWRPVKGGAGKQPGAKKEEAKINTNAMPKVNGPDMAVRNFESKGEKVTNWNGTKNGFLISTTKGDYQYEEKADGSFELMDRPNVTQGEALQQSIKSHGEKAGSKPALSQIDGKGNKVEIKITPTKGGGFYVDKYVNGKKIGLEHGNTRESAEAKAKSMMEQHMADPDYKAESKPDAAEQRDKIGDEIKESLEAAEYYYRKAKSFYPTDPSYKTYMLKAKQYNDEAKAQADDNGFDFEEMHNSGITQAVNKYAEEQSKPAAPRRESVSAGRMQKDLDGNFWSRPEDFKEDITSRGWDVDEMTNEYAVISNEAGSQYEVRFDDHSDDGDLTVKRFKALQIDEDDDDDSLEDSAPRVLTGDTKIHVKDARRTYQIGEISETTGKQKTANGWVKPKNGKQPGAKKENPTRSFEFKSGPDGMPVAGSGKEVKTYKTKKEAQEALKKQNTAASNVPAGVPSFHGMESGDYDKKLRAEGWTTGGWEGSGTHASAIFKKGDRTIRVNEGQPGKITSIQEISKPSENKPAAQFLGLEAGPDTGAKLSHKDHVDLANEVKANGDNWTAEEIAKEWNLTKGDAEAVKKEIDNASKPAAESKPAEGRNFREAMEREPKSSYDFAKTVEHSIPMTAGDKEILGRVKSFMQEEGTDYKNALKAVATGLVNGNKLHGDWYPEKEQSLLKIAKAVGMDNEVKSYVKTMAKGYDFGYSEDAAPRQLTGDCKIRIRK